MRPAPLVLLLLLAPLASAAPEQVHVGLRAAGMAVQWVDLDPNGPTFLTLRGPEDEARVEARVVPGPTPGVVREALLPPLTPGHAYSYDVGGRTFDLRPLPADGAFAFVALGDMGTTRAAGATVDALKTLQPSLVLHAGDVSYAGGDPRVWKAWFDLVEPVAATAPWLPALGNHEGDVQGIATDEAAVVDPAEQATFKQRFPLPADTFWYSFDRAGVHFVALDTFSELQMPAAEVEWLKADLAAAKDATWIVVYLHEPPYSSNAAHGSSPRAHGAFAKVLEDAGVDLVVAAHDHSYERTHALRDGKVVSRSNVTTKGEGTVYVVTGGAGASLYETFVDPPPEWSAARAAVHHVLAVDVTPQRLAARVVTTTGADFADAFVIERPAPGLVDEVDDRVPGPSLAAVALAGIAAAFALRRR